MTVALATASCTPSVESNVPDQIMSVPDQILSPAPKPTVGPPATEECVVGIIRADRIPAERLPEEMSGRLPTRLPPGFGLMMAWRAETESALGEPGPGAIWADAGCSLIRLTIYPGESEPVGQPSVGTWVLSQSGQCFYAPVGEQTCLEYRTKIPEGHLSLSTFALTRQEAERVVSSVILD
jgi:hypothetical protein